MDKPQPNTIREVIDEYLDLNKHIGEMSFDEWAKQFKRALNEAAKHVTEPQTCESS